MSAQEKNLQNKININPSYLQRCHHFKHYDYHYLML